MHPIIKINFPCLCPFGLIVKLNFNTRVMTVYRKDKYSLKSYLEKSVSGAVDCAAKGAKV